MIDREKKEEIFNQLMESFSSFIRSHILKYNLQRFGLDAEDLVQEIKLKVWKIIDDEKTINCPPSYLKKVIESAVIDQIRRIRKEEEIFYSERQKLISEIEPRGSSYNEQFGSLKELMIKAADRLLDSRKTVVKLYLLNMSLPEISDYLNYSQAKTRNLLYRGLEDLKTILIEMGLTNERERPKS
ncbi:MAG TPA: sigma-70 family RNA polymerase sigma factor [Candidatus Saccharicenans sp.]|nr:sigma-70 family RNA polymerase sigma factor [Candidatus Saccharicenans sp.]HPU92726.1 sigma-70 family RNA polymerase sigma factor [Candidatus Saccharicenans sp.]